MAGTKPDPFELSEGSLEALIDFFRERFAGDLTLRRAIESVLVDILDHWGSHQGMEPASFEELNNGLGPHLKALMEIPSSDAKSPCDALVASWDLLKPRLVWL